MKATECAEINIKTRNMLYAAMARSLTRASPKILAFKVESLARFVSSSGWLPAVGESKRTPPYFPPHVPPHPSPTPTLPTPTKPGYVHTGDTYASSRTHGRHVHKGDTDQRPHARLGEVVRGQQGPPQKV